MNIYRLLEKFFFCPTCILTRKGIVGYHTEVRIYKRKILRKKERNHAFDQEKTKENKILTNKKERKQDLDQEKQKEN